jgi:hypothetical protein
VPQREGARAPKGKDGKSFGLRLRQIADIARGVELSHAARHLLLLVGTHIGQHGWAWPGVGELTGRSGYTARSVRNALAELHRSGIVLNVQAWVLERLYPDRESRAPQNLNSFKSDTALFVWPTSPQSLREALLCVLRNEPITRTQPEHDRPEWIYTDPENPSERFNPVPWATVVRNMEDGKGIDWFIRRITWQTQGPRLVADWPRYQSTLNIAPEWARDAATAPAPERPPGSPKGSAPDGLGLSYDESARRLAAERSVTRPERRVFDPEEHKRETEAQVARYRAARADYDASQRAFRAAAAEARTCFPAQVEAARARLGMTETPEEHAKAEADQAQAEYDAARSRDEIPF